MTYDNDSDTNTGGTRYDQNTKGAHKDIDTENNVQNDRCDNTVTQSKWSTETNEIDNWFLRDYNIMHRQMEDRQIDEYYKAQRQIYSTMMGDTLVKTVHNRQYNDNISAYDSEVQRISKSVQNCPNCRSIFNTTVCIHTKVIQCRLTPQNMTLT